MSINIPSHSPPSSSGNGGSHHSQLHLDLDWVIFLRQHAEWILNVLTPSLWCLLLIFLVDKKDLFESWFMPFLGVIAAFLANSVPIGGGIVYIPALSLLGAQISLGASFTIATMPIGNGIFGFLRWLIKDPSVFIWESFQYTVLPSWIGSIIAMLLLPTPDNHLIKLFFGLFCFFIGVLVLLALYRGGLRNVFFNLHERHDPELTDNRFDSEIQLTEHGLPVYPPKPEASYSIGEEALHRQWLLVSGVSFLGGLILVPNIGIGPALITYFMLVLLGYKEQRAIVTGIVTGGWVCIVPFLIHIYRNNVPYALWVLVLPGVFYGAKVSYSPFDSCDLMCFISFYCFIL
jgi:uncharacterized membrane protein YfcA